MIDVGPSRNPAHWADARTAMDTAVTALWDAMQLCDNARAVDNIRAAVGAVYRAQRAEAGLYDHA